MNTRAKLSELSREELKRRSILAMHELDAQSLEQYSREHNDVELAKRNGIDLSQPPSWELEDDNEDWY
jgi:hypothetical protein